MPRRTADVTGGAPELNPHVRQRLDEGVRSGVNVMDRCNLTVLLLPRRRDLSAWPAERNVEVVCSPPHWRGRITLVTDPVEAPSRQSGNDGTRMAPGAEA